jgi:mono/diheme cytochrome c family protein
MSLPFTQAQFFEALGRVGAILLLLTLFVPFLAWGQDIERGRLLYQTHCGGCHYERTHDERLRPAVRDLSELRDMVAQWAPHTKRTYTLDELEDIAQYLNEAHYRFGLSPRETKRGAQR